MAEPAVKPGVAPLLAVDDLAVRYGRAVQALRGVSLHVDDGAIVAVLGNNGAGKSPLLRTVSGIHRLHRAVVERGGVRFDGRSLTGVDPGRIVSSGVVQ